MDTWAVRDKHLLIIGELLYCKEFGFTTYEKTEQEYRTGFSLPVIFINTKSSQKVGFISERFIYFELTKNPSWNKFTILFKQIWENSLNIINVEPISFKTDWNHCCFQNIA